MSKDKEREIKNIMTVEEKEALKEELRAEIKKEMEKARNHSFWYAYAKESIEPLLEQKFTNTKLKWATRSAINTIARALLKKSSVNRITEEELETIKPKIEAILEML